MRRRDLLAAVSAAAVAMAPSTGHAVRVVAEGPTFVVMEDDGGTFEHARWNESWDLFQPAFALFADAYYAAAPDEIELLLVYQTFATGSLGGFFMPVANDVRGIGMAHQVAHGMVPDEIFDASGGRRVRGLVDLGPYRRYMEDPGRVDRIFLHELGHAGGPYVYVAHDGVPPYALLGRDDAHWSFYLDHQGSPLEGNTWRDNADGSFTTVTRQPFRYSDLDLYLMGLLPPAEVGPFFLVADPAPRPGGPPVPDRGAAPALHGDLTVLGRRVDLTLDDVVAAEGARLPAAAAPRVIPVGVVVLVRKGETLGDDAARDVAAVLEVSARRYGEATRGKAMLCVRSGRVAGDGCAHVDADAIPRAGGCAVAAPPLPRGPAIGPLLAAAAGMMVGRRRISRPTRR